MTGTWTYFLATGTDPTSPTRGTEAEAFAEDVVLSLYETGVDLDEPDLPWLLAALAGSEEVPDEEIAIVRETTLRLVEKRR
jgi:2-hydroxychromene-2-carboxylate isomerase